MAKKTPTPPGKLPVKGIRPSNAATGKAKAENRYWFWGLAVGILLITGLLYAHSLKNGFTNWDDPVYVIENQMITQLSGENLSDIFSKPVSLNYHPITMLSLAIDYHFHQLDPSGYHATNLLFHLLNTFLVFVLFYLLSGRKLLLASTVSLLFAIHPMHVESVAWVAERKDVLYAFFYLLALICYSRFLDTRKFLWLAIAFLPFGLSLLSKAVAVTIPVVFFGMDYWKGRSFSWKLVLEKVPFLVVSIVIGLVAYQIQSEGAIAKPGVLSLWQRVIFASYGFWMYVYKLFLPLNLSTFYPYPALDVPGGSLPLIYQISPFIALVLAGLVGWSYRKTKLFLFGFFFYIVTVALVLQFISVGNAVMADRYSYLPYLGLFFILGYGLQKAWEDRGSKWHAFRLPLAAGMGLFALWLGTRTYQQIKVWENNESLWTQVIDHYPTGWVAYKNRGNYYGEKGDVEKAMTDYQVLIANKQMDDQVYANLGNIYRMKNQYDKALEAYETAARMDPSDPTNLVNRGIIYSIYKRYGEALTDFDRALQAGAPYPKVGPNKAYLLLSMSNWEGAIQEYNRVIALFPNELTHYQNRGLAFYNMNRYEEAIRDFDAGLRISPGQPGLLFNLSVVYFKMGQNPKALDFAKQAKAAGQPVTDAYLAQLSQKG